MPNINFKFDADSSKVERAIKRLGTEFEKVVNTGDNIDKTLLDFSALVDKSADKVQNLKSEMQKLNAVNLQNMATQFERINAGSFNELIQGLRNTQTGAVGVGNSIEDLITKLGLSRNSLQQVTTSMRQALGNMGYGSAEYTATLSQLATLEQAMSRIDQNVTAGASNTFAANQAKIASTQGYASILQQSISQVQQSNAEMTSNTLNTVIIGGSRLTNFVQGMVREYFTAMKRIESATKEAAELMVIEMENSTSAQERLIAEAYRFREANNGAIPLRIFEDNANPKAPAFIEFMQKELRQLVDDLHNGVINYEEFVTRVQSIDVNSLAAFDTIKKTIKDQNNLYDIALVDLKNKNHPSMQINSFFDEKKLSRSAENMMAFAMEVKDASELTQKTLAELKGKSELEIQAISNALQKLKQQVPIDSPVYKAATTQIGLIGQKMQETAKANQALAGGSTSATMAIQQLGFAVGDASMVTQNWKGALMGIGNNIPFVIGNIMEMNAAAKTAGTSGFKAFTTALAGPAGILLAVNATLFALQVLPDIYTSIGNAAGGASSKMKKLTDATKLSSIMADEAVVKNIGEAKSLQSLTVQLKATTAGSTERKKIVSEIIAINPEAVKGIDLNTASEKELGIWIDKTISSLREKIKAQLTDIVLAPVYAKFAEAYAKYAQAQEDYTTALNDKNMVEVNQLISGRTNDLSKDSKYLLAKQLVDIAEKRQNEAKAKLDKSFDTSDFGRATDTVDFYLNQILGKEVKPVVKEPKKKDDGDGSKSGKDGKGDEYTALEKLNSQWDLLIAKETDADKIAFLKYQKAFSIWELTQKVVKEQEDRDSAHIQYLEAEKEYALYLLDIKDKYDSKITDQTKADQASMKASNENYIEMRMKAIESLKELSERTKLEGMSESEQLEYDMKKELNEVEVDDFGLKEERKFQITEYFANKRIQIERSSWDRGMSIVSNALGAYTAMFTQYTDSYKAFAIAQVGIDMWVGATSAFRELPFPLDWVQFSAVLAQGYASIDEITKVSAYAKGGIVSQPTLGLVGEAGAEIIAPVRDFQSYSRDLIQSANGGFGSGDKELVAHIKGTDLMFMMQRVEKRANRQKVGGSV